MACKETIFDPFISSTAISNTYVNSILKGNYSHFLKKKLIKAREAFEHFDYEQHGRNKRIITEFTGALRQIKQAYTRIQDQTTKAMSYIRDTMDDITPRLNFHISYAMEYIKQMINVNFVRGWEITDERTLKRVTSKFYETISMYDKTISQLLSMSQGDEPKREVRNKPTFSPKILLQKRVVPCSHCRFCAQTLLFFSLLQQSYKIGSRIV